MTDYETVMSKIGASAPGRASRSRVPGGAEGAKARIATSKAAEARGAFVVKESKEAPKASAGAQLKQSVTQGQERVREEQALSGETGMKRGAGLFSVKDHSTGEYK